MEILFSPAGRAPQFFDLAHNFSFAKLRREDWNERRVMKNQTYLSMALAWGCCLGWATAADVTGKITLNGKPPAEEQIEFDAQCAAVHPDKGYTQFYKVDAQGGLADVVVYLKTGVPKKEYPVPAEPLVIDQKGCIFVPYVSAIMARQKVLIKNSDPLMHNINHSPVPDVQKRPQNIAQMPDAKPLERAFEKSYDLQNPQDITFVRIKCDVHRWMFSYIAVFDHPYFSLSGQDGQFTIRNVPPGKYTLEAYHRKAGRVTREIEVGGQNVTADFTLAPKPKS